ncbi:hypothetical protein OE766_11940 [Pararhizobium sp. YC-54]|uniref:hypothetical protein n=1 Tax=Pararhizobium sp. YC-54 TaxID=2986920 RepID=UPI0021F6A0A2|nr:hypothetical protein [Pararhizobium sp. YC-54]MCV9998960.1 hypothetical protein [Pararhizobium sp. YC-54]
MMALVHHRQKLPRAAGPGDYAPLFETAGKIAAALEVPTPVLFGAGNAPSTGERARLLTDINGTLSRMNDEQLSRATKMLKAFLG